MKRYLDPGEQGKRSHKTNLSRGAFGQPHFTMKLNNIFEKISKKLPLATPKGKINSTYVQVKQKKTSKKSKPTIKKD